MPQVWCMDDFRGSVREQKKEESITRGKPNPLCRRATLAMR